MPVSIDPLRLMVGFILQYSFSSDISLGSAESQMIKSSPAYLLLFSPISFVDIPALAYIVLTHIFLLSLCIAAFISTVGSTEKPKS